MPKLILTIGIPGCGKSSWIRSCITIYPIVSPDNIRKELSGDISNQSLNSEVWKIAKERTVGYLNKGYSVILDATNVSTFHRGGFLQDLPLCILQAKVFVVSPRIAYERICTDLANKVDRPSVPEDVVYKMHEDLLISIPLLEAEGFTLI